MSAESHQSTGNGSVTFSEVRNAELKAIQAAFPDADENELVGLAFSGGGIRSATFGLGVLEGLKKLGLLNRIHYLSTVSGGGYIGSWFSANCRRACDRGDRRDWRSSEADWSRSVQYLRDYSNYLSPEVGFFSADTWSMFTIWIRNALLVQVTIALAVACVLLVPRLAVWVFGVWPDAGNFRWISVFLFITSIAGIAGNLQQVSTAKPNSWRRWLLQKERAWAGLALSIACGASAWIISRATGFDPFGPRPIDPWIAFVVAGLLVLGGYCLLPVALAVFDALVEGDYTQVNYGQTHVQWFIVLPLLVCSYLFGAILWDLSNTVLSTPQTYGALFLRAWRDWPFPLSVVFVSLWGLAFCSIEQWRVKGPLVALIAALGSVVALHALLCAIVLVLQPWATDSMDHAFVAAPVMVLYAFALTIVVLIGLVGRQSLEGVREWWSRLGAWLMIYGAAWVIVTVAAVYGPRLVYLAFREHFWVSLSSLGGWVGTILTGLLAGHSEQTGRDEARRARSPLLEIVAFVAPFLFIAGLLIGVSTLVDLVIQANTHALTWQHVGGNDTNWTIFRVSLAVLGVSFGLLALLGWRTDVNVFSLNAFYRNRLVRAYLGATRLPNAKSPDADSLTDRRNPQNFTGFDEKDDLPLAELIGKKLAGPMHIVNCALNLGGASDLALHTRHSASFTLSPLYAGSDYEHCDASGTISKVGYVPTALYGGRPEETTLGKAVSVSGAAASPNMGYHTSPVVAFLLTVFNLRLGWWFANPARNYARRAPRFNLRYMILELFGSATGRSKFLMVSDGGHFENLAVYELIKRRCKVIIVSDAECDPTMSFEGLGSLIRMCEVDFGVRITIDVGSLRPRAGAPWSEQRCAVGTIDYGGGRTGHLVYLKAAMTGHEPTAVLQYKARHPHFPHETTGDQFYAEDQFESYRRLGSEVTCCAFDNAIAVVGSRDMVALARTLAQTNAPTLQHVEHFTRHTKSLISLWNKLQKSPDLRPLDPGLFGTALNGGSEDGTRLRRYTCAEMLQLMENVYLDLRLDETWDHADNSGWRTLFTRWSELDELRSTWRETSHLFGVRFGYFCERNLKLSQVKKLEATG